MKILFVVPYFNHPDKISDVIKRLQQISNDILIVDDGSNENSKKVILNLNVQILTKVSNEGKGSAIKSAFFWALENGFSHIFQIDADFQHDLEQIPKFITLATKNPNSIICGHPIYSKDAPKSRLYGRKITDLWVFINSLGAIVKDCLIGMRIYPINNLKNVINLAKTNRMEFDIDIILCAYKNNIDIKWLDVKIFYRKENVSHFKVFRDNMLISKMHAKHFLGLPKLIFKKVFRG